MKNVDEELMTQTIEEKKKNIQEKLAVNLHR